MTDSGESVTPDNSIILPTVWRCVALLSTVIAGCPLRTYKNPGKKEKFPILFDPGNTTTRFTQFELWELVVAHLCLWGNAYVRKIRNPLTDQVVDLAPIEPGRVKVKVSNKYIHEKFGIPLGEKIFEIKQVNPETGIVDPNAKPIVLTTWELMHIPGLGYDGVQGMSPIGLANRTIGTAMAGDRLAARFYAKGSMLSGVLNVKVPLTNQRQADSIRSKWIQKMGGVSHAAEVAVLDAETTFQPLTIPPDQLQFLQSRRWQTTEIARLFGIPPHLVGDVEKSTSWGTGIEQQNVGFVCYTVSGYTNRIEQRCTREVISTNKQFCEFDLDRLLRGDMAERFAAYAVGIQWGWLTRNEARIKENMQPIDGLDEPLTPLNMQTGNPNDILGPAGAGASPTQGKESPKNQAQAGDDDDDSNRAFLS